MTANCDLAFMFSRTDHESFVMRRNSWLQGGEGWVLGWGELLDGELCRL